MIYTSQRTYTSLEAHAILNFDFSSALTQEIFGHFSLEEGNLFFESQSDLSELIDGN